MNNQQSIKALILSTLAFAISFAVWGMIAPMAKTLQSLYHLSDKQTWALISIPVILGSIMRLPMGMLADRYGGRLIFSILLIFISIPAFVLSYAHDYQSLVIGGLFLGMAGTSFSIGVSFASRWFSQDKQGLALGVYGAGNIGQSIALFSIPILAGMFHWQTTYRIFALVALVYGVLFYATAKNAPQQAQPKSFSDMIKVLASKPLSWLLSLFYFVTFGGFVALSIGLPKLLQELFHLSAKNAGLRVAGFVLVATIMRPIGGWLSDKIGGAKVLTLVFTGAGLLALCLTQTDIIWFTIGALGVAFCIGLGNGAVFKLVPQHFPKDTGTVTGLVGAIGGMGGFFPPLVLSIIKDYMHDYSLGFVLLSVFCFVCLVLNWIVFLRNKTLKPAYAIAGE